MNKEEKEAIEVLKEIQNSLYVEEYHYEWQLAINTTLNYIDKLQKELDNSISKDTIRDKIKELEDILEEIKNFSDNVDKGTYIDRVKTKILVLEELLGE